MEPLFRAHKMNESIKFVDRIYDMNVNLNLIKPIVFAFILGGILDLNAQAVKLVGGLSNPTDMAIDGNTMYISDYKTGKIHRFKLGIPNPILTPVASGFGGPFGMAIKGSELFVAEYDSSQISKINLKQSKPIKQKVLEVQGVSDLEFIGDTLFAVNFDFNRIEYVLDLELNPSLNTYANANGPFRLLVKDSLLFVNEASKGSISKINRFSNSPLPQAFSYSFNSPAGMAEHEGILYVAENTSDTISSINLLDLSQAKKTVATNVDGPDVLLVHESILYISEFDKGQISTISLDPLSNNLPDNGIPGLYPNPCRSYLNVHSSNRHSTYSIYAITGKRLFFGLKASHGCIDMSRLNNGIYILMDEKNKTQIFTKH